MIRITVKVWVFIFLILMTFCSSGYKNLLRDENKIKYVLTISWKDSYHKTISHYWLLEKSRSTLQEFDNLKFNDLQFKVTPLVKPRYFQEYLFCCEQKSVDYINRKNSQFLIDSLGKKYQQEYEKNYGTAGEGLKLNQKKVFVSTKQALNRKYHVRFFKITADVCRCKAANNNPGSFYNDTIANIHNITSFQNLSKMEKKQFKSNIDSLFLNKMIQEGLPSD